MLVLTRTSGPESNADVIYLHVPPSAKHQVIEVKLCVVEGERKAKVGITAPKEIQVVRSEIAGEWRGRDGERDGGTP